MFIIRVKTETGVSVAHESGIKYETEERAMGAIELLHRMGESRELSVGQSRGRPPGSRNRPKSTPPPPSDMPDKMFLSKGQLSAIIAGVTETKPGSGEFELDLTSLKGQHVRTG